ncbi:hypothetical protein HMPREF9069_00185, partial [Atopobium sp. oral taxon 810 str. F0209]
SNPWLLTSRAVSFEMMYGVWQAEPHCLKECVAFDVQGIMEVGL